MSSPRHDLYAGIHKALRLGMSRTLCQLGSADALDPEALRAALAQLQRLLSLCASHLKHEEAQIHPLLQRIAGGACADVCADHQHHREAIAELAESAAQIPGLPAADRVAALTALYRAVAVFVGENFVHMETEEREHNAMLWAHCSDAELEAVHQRIVQAIEPAVMMDIMGWFLPAQTPAERAAMLTEMRAAMPAPAFAAVLEVARASLDAASLGQLLRSLAPQAEPQPA